MTEWRVIDKNGTEIDGLFDVELTDTNKAFGDSGVAFIDDSQGTKFDKFPRGTRLDFEVKLPSEADADYRKKLIGYVVERRKKEKNGADVLELECYSVNMLLQRGEVKSDLSGQSITDALKQVIQNATPITWNASKVNIQDDKTVTRPFLNERSDDVIQQLVLKSAGENFYVDDSLEFVCEPGESKKVARGVDDSQWTDYDIPQIADEEINEVRVYFDDGNRKITVDNAANKQELGNELGTSDPVSFTEAKMFREIDNRKDAQEAGREVLQGRQPTLTGTVTTYELLDADPGDTIDIRIREAGVNAEFVIAQVEYRWGMDETVLTIVENKGDIDDMLKRMSDTLKRVEMRPAAREGDLKEDTITIDIGGSGSGTDTGLRILTEVAGSVDSTNVDQEATVTNSGYNKIRDAYINDNTVSIANILVGTDGSPASRSDTSLGSQSESVSATINTPSGDKVEVTNSSTLSTGDDIEELGFEATDGTLLARATVDAVTDPDNATLSVTFNDDPDTAKTVLTNTGQTLLRDILADNSPTHVDRYVFGDGTSDVSETDSALGNELARVDVGDATIALANSESTWRDVTDFSDTDVHLIDSDGNLEMAQTAFVRDAQDLNNSQGQSTFSDSNYTGGTGVNLQNTDGANTFFFVLTYEPEDSMAVALRGELNDGNFNLTVGGEAVATGPLTDGTLNWTQNDLSRDYSIGDFVTVSIEGGSSGTDKLDVITVYDTAFQTASNFDNDNGGSSGYLDTPGNYPENAQQASLLTQNASRSTTSGSITSTWDDTSGGQQITVEGDTKSNTSSGDFSFTETDSYDISFTTDAWNTQTGTTPLTRVESQTVEDFRFDIGDSGKTIAGIGTWEIEASVPAGGDLDGDTVKEVGQLDSGGNLVSRTRVADTAIGSGESVIANELCILDAESRPDDTAFFDVAVTDQNRS